jgi:hypothetical protein
MEQQPRDLGKVLVSREALTRLPVNVEEDACDMISDIVTTYNYRHMPSLRMCSFPPQ